jgi:hypothetical protein
MGLIEEAAGDALAVAVPPLGIAMKAWGFVKSYALPLLVAVVVLGAGAAFALHEWRSAATAKAQAKLDTNLAGAAQSSASDAVNTVTRTITNERNITNEVNHEISAVQAASDGAGADAAGRDGLCHLAADLCPTGSVQRPNP